VFEDNRVVHFNNPDNLQKSKRLTIDSNKLLELRKNYENNVGIVNLEANIPDEKGNDNLKMKNLTVQQIPRVDLKPDLVTQKLANIQIKPNNIKTSQ